MQKMPDIAVMLIATDGNMQIYDVNPEVCREFGYSREELVGQHIGRYLTETSRQMIKERVQFRETLGGISEMQVDVVTKTGELLPVEISTTRYLDDDGKQLWAQATLINMTAAKATVQQRLELVSQMQETQRSLNAFSRVASAQLRQPLSMLDSFTTMISSKIRPVLQSGVAEQLDMLQFQIKQFEAVVERMTSLAVVNEAADLQVVDLQALLDSALKPLQARIDEQQATIIVEGELPLVTIGSNQLGLVLHNLVDNALLYASPDRPLAVYIIGRTQGSQIELVIADNGVGFDPATKEAAFDAFRERNSGAGPQRLGVGLAVCRRIMEQLQGSIDVKPVPGKGCEFTLRFADNTPDPSLSQASA